MYVQFTFCIYGERFRWNHLLVKNTITKLEFFHQNNCFIDLKGAWEFNLSSFFFLYNSLHNNSGFYKALVHVLFTISKTELVSTVRNLKYVYIIPLKTKTILSTILSTAPTLPHVNKSLTLTLEKIRSKKITAFRFCLTLFGFLKETQLSRHIKLNPANIALSLQ